MTAEEFKYILSRIVYIFSIDQLLIFREHCSFSPPPHPADSLRRWNYIERERKEREKMPAWFKSRAESREMISDRNSSIPLALSSPFYYFCYFDVAAAAVRFMKRGAVQCCYLIHYRLYIYTRAHSITMSAKWLIFTGALYGRRAIQQSAVSL